MKIIKSVRVFAPSTVANVGCGFDAMGFAFEGAGDEVVMQLIEGSDAFEYINESGVPVPTEPEENLMTYAIRAMQEHLGKSYGVRVIIKKKILPGSGIGSSAAAAVSAVVGYNSLVESNFTDEELIDFALEGECIASGSKHADNVAPSLLGGIVLVRDYNPTDVIRVQWSRPIYCAVIHPLIEVKTKDSRAVLPTEIPLRTAIRQWANLASMVSAMGIGDYGMMSRALQDHVAEPCRKQFIPGYDELKADILQAGALGANISGSGPSVFALCKTQAIAEKVGKVMLQHFVKRNIPANVYTSPITPQGARIIE